MGNKGFVDGDVCLVQRPPVHLTYSPLHEDSLQIAWKRHRCISPSVPPLNCFLLRFIRSRHRNLTVFLAELDRCFAASVSPIFQLKSNAWRWAIYKSGQWRDQSLNCTLTSFWGGEQTHTFYLFIYFPSSSPSFPHFLFLSRGQMHKAS